AEGEDKGTYTITAAGEVEQGNYEVTFEEGTFTINVRPVTVTIDNKTSAYKEEIVTLTSSVTEGTVVDGDNLGIKLTTTATNTSVVGIYEIVGTAGNTNYDITFIDGEYEITPAIITESNIKVSDPANLTYNKEEKEVSVSINANNNTLIEDTEYVLDIKYYAGEEVSEETLMGKPRNAGTYTARVIVTGINNYTTVNGEETTVVIDRTFTIEKADPEVPTMPTGITAKYDETLQVVENKLIALGTGFSIDVVANALTDKVGNAGTQTIKVKYTPEDTENYNVMSGLDLDITVEQIPAITDYEILPIEVDYMTTYEGIQNKLQEQNPGWALRGITEMLETPNAGKITLAVVYAGDANHTEVVDEVEVTINKIEKPATTKVLEATFGQTLGDIKEQLPTGWSFVDSDETSVGNAGNNSFNIVYGEDTNYKETAGTITVHVGKGTLTLTYPTASSLTYGQKLSESRLTGGSTLYGEFRWKNANEVPTVNNNGYLVEFVPNAETAGNFEITNSEQRVAITVAKAIIDVDQLQYKTVSYAVNGTKQDEEDSLTVTYNGYRRAIEVATDLPEGAKPEIANDKDSQVNAGTYANIRVAFTDTDNYTFTKSEAFVTLTIEKADIDVSAICEDFANRGTTIVEDEEKHSIRVNETLLAKLPGKVSVKYNIEEVSAPGTYTIIATFIVEDTQNYNEIKEQAKSVLVIQKAAVKPNIKFVNDIYEGGKTYTDTEGKETSYGTLTWDVGTSCIIKRNGQNYYTSTAAGSVNLTSDGLYEVTIKNGDKTSTAKIRIMVEDYEVKLPTEGLNSKGKYIVDVDLSIGENFTNLYGLNYKVEVIDDSTGEIKTFNKPTAGTKFHTIEQQSTEKTYTIKLYIDGKVEQEKQIIIRPRTTTK
ncbi:MAG: hypothetical protein HFJ54_05100, partial [Clostridia bacterium]|nr:hypothetical protein [Clostridia bacterium]